MTSQRNGADALARAAHLCRAPSLGELVVTLQTSMEFFATLSCALFAGAAVDINAVEHPARMSCGTEVAATVWAPSYQRATWMQAPLALVGCLTAVMAWLAGASASWFLGGVLLGLVVPFTVVVIQPTNTRLLSADLDKRSDEAHRLLARWNCLHGVRTALRVVALVVFLANG
jgi:Anthrone oxygenase